MMSPLKDPLRIENVEDLEEDLPSCGKYFEKDLNRHIGRVHGEKKWSCEQCDAKFIVKSNLDRHVKEVHIGELVKCDLCHYKAKDKRYVIQHATKAHPLVDVNKMKLHIVNFLKEEKEKKKTLLKFINKNVPLCPHCGKEFSREYNLMHHITFTHGGQVFECNFCSMCYKDKRGLVKHVASNHPFENLDEWMKIKVEQLQQERKIDQK